MGLEEGIISSLLQRLGTASFNKSSVHADMTHMKTLFDKYVSDNRSWKFSSPEDEFYANPVEIRTVHLSYGSCWFVDWF